MLDGAKHRGEPEAGPFANLFGREKRVEDLRLHVIGNPGPVIIDFEDHGFLIRVVPRPHDEDAAAVGRQHGLFGVDDQVEQDLLDLMAVGEYLRQAGGERVDDGDVGDALLVGAQGQRFADHEIHVDHRARRLALAGEGQQVPHDPRRALRFAEDRLEPAADRVLERGALRQAFGPAQNGRERVVQLVRDARDRLAERGHLLGLEQLVKDVAGLIVELLALADVADERFDADRRIPGRRIRARRDLDPHGAVVGAPEP